MTGESHRQGQPQTWMFLVFVIDNFWGTLRSFAGGSEAVFSAGNQVDDQDLTGP